MRSQSAKEKAPVGGSANPWRCATQSGAIMEQVAEEVQEAKKSKKQRILEWLQAGNSLTPAQAWQMFKCYRLSARIFELREAGHAIKTIGTEDGPFAIYRLETVEA